MSKQDYYTILGVERTVTEVELKRAYRTMAMKHHPDKNPGNSEAEAHFKRVSEAYEVLKDPHKRAAYDRYGHAAFEGNSGAGPQGFDFGDFSSVMEEMFQQFSGGRGRAQAQREGQDLRYDLDITLEEAFSGTKKTIHVPTRVPCAPCKGTGMGKESTLKTCTTCSGAGRVRMAQGFFMVEQTCVACQGNGEVIEKPCKECNGAGRIPGEYELEVQIPAGVESGTRVRVSGKGEAGLRGAPAGDLYVFLTVHAHERFDRDGPDLQCVVRVPMVTAALGGEISVPLISGETHMLEIPEGTQTGREFILKGEGMPVLQRAKRGSMHVFVHVVTPTGLTKAEKEHLKGFQSSRAEGADEQDGQELHQGFFQKVRHFFQARGA